MKRTRKNYSPEFKAKVVLELLQENKTINEIASKYGILPKSLIEWKKTILRKCSLSIWQKLSCKGIQTRNRKPKRRKWKISKKIRKSNRRERLATGKAKKLGLID